MLIMNKHALSKTKTKKLMFLFMKYLKSGTLQNTPGKLPLKNSPLVKTPKSMYILYTDKL